MIDTVRDREIASKATDGPWVYKIGERYIRNKHRNIIAKDHTFETGVSEYIAHFNPKYIQELIDAVDERDALRELLKVAACPANCVDGAYPNNYGEPIQCQFCYEREQLLSQSNQEPNGGCDE